MNIFVLDYDMKTSVQFYVKKHITKMPLEYAQLLSTAIRLNDGVRVETTNKNGKKVTKYNLGIEYKDITVYEATHVGNPLTIWAKESRAHWIWLKELAMTLREEFFFRRNKYHISSEITSKLPVPKNFKEENWLGYPPLVMPDEYKKNDVVESYRSYYVGGKIHLAEWENRNQPEWFIK